MAIWTDEMTFCLIQIWGEDTIQAQLEGCKRNIHVYEKIAKEINEKYPDDSWTAQQCRDKIKKLRAEYRKLKDKHNLTGRGRAKWKFFDKMDEILGNKHATKPPVVLDTLGSDQAEEPTAINSDEDTLEERQGNEGEHESKGNDERQIVCSDSARVSEPRSPGRSRSSTPVSSIVSERKRPSKSDKIDQAMASIVDKVLLAQNEADKKYMELEEKRMKLEEKMEREDERRREEREFQLKMFQMMTHGPEYAPYYAPFGLQD